MTKKHLTLEITSPEGQVFHSTDIDKVILPGKHGVITVLPGHIDLSATLTDGEISIYGLECERECEHFKLTGGFVQITDNHRVDVLTEHLESTSK